MVRPRKRHLALEHLEERRFLTAFGVPWPEIGHLTLSFAPDGTAAGSQASNLFATLNAQMPTKQWQEDILRAFQTWAVQSNINIGVVADGGQAFGTLGLKQSDPRFGDVRIGAYPMGADVLAVANPYDPFVANTWVGDVFLNSDYTFGDNGANSNYDLFSVALHEAGHVFGLGHSTDPNSPMFAQFHADDSLTPADAANLQALYGPRQADDWEGPAGNGTFATATALNFSSSGSGLASIAAAADIGSLSDVDTFSLVAPPGAKSLDVEVEAAGYSLLTPRLTVFDAAGRTLSSAVTTDPLNNNLSISVEQVESGNTYYVQVSSGRSDVFGIGSYQLHVQADGPNSTAAGSAGDPSSAAASGGTNGLAAIPAYTAQDYLEQNGLQLLATTPGYVEHTYYELVDAVSPAVATRTYEVQSADLGSDMTNVMTVALNFANNPNVKFKVTIRDDQGNLMPTKTIANFAGHIEVQAAPVGSARDYFVKVRSYYAPADGATYELRVDFAQDGKHLETFVSDSLSRGQQSVSRILQVQQSQAFHFELAASDWGVPAETGVRMEIEGQDGKVVYSMSVADGAVRSGDVFLDQGRYTVTFSRAAQGVDTPVIFQLSGLTTSEPLGPQLRDTIQEPLDSPASSTLAQLTFYWLPNDPGPATASLLQNDARASVDARDSDGAAATTILARDIVMGKAGPADGNRAVQSTRDEREATVVFALPTPLDDTVAAEDTANGMSLRQQFSVVRNRLGAVASSSRRNAREDSWQPRAQEKIPGHAKAAATRLAPFSLVGSPPTATDPALSGTAAEWQFVGRSAPQAAANSADNRDPIDRVFAWIQSLEAVDYADWAAVGLCMIASWRALKGPPERRVVI